MFKKTVANLVKLVPQVFKHPLTTHNHIGSYHTNFKDLHYFSQSKLNNGFNTQIKKYFSSISTTKENNTKKNIQSGGNFEDLVTNSSIFIDKSLFIKEIIEDSAKTILITMPRRWGKSLNLDMFKRFLSIEEMDSKTKELNKQIFKQSIKTNLDKTKSQLNISTTQIKITDENIIGQTKVIDSLELQGQYPVIFIDFKDCKGSNFEDVAKKLQRKIVETIEKFGYLDLSQKTYSGKITIGQKYNELFDQIRLGNFDTAVKELSTLLYAHHGKKVWILIDEYDAAVNKAYLEFNDEEAKQVSELFRGIFESALKGNNNLEKGVLTGVQYIVKSGMLSGLNNLSKYNIINFKYSQYYGINQEEMNDLMQHFEIEESQAAKIKDWYNGYQENIGTDENKIFIDKYNIWSVVNYLNRQNDGFRSYWEESGSVDFIKPLFKQQNFKKKIEDLVNAKNIKIDELAIDFSVDNFRTLKQITNSNGKIEINSAGFELIFSYLFITGYLTIANDKNTEFKLPNKEIKTELEKNLKNYYKTIFSIEPEKFSELTEILNVVFEQKNSLEIKEIFEKNFGPKFSELIKNVKMFNKSNENSIGLFANEDLMHSLLNNIVLQIVNGSFASERYTVKTDGTKGRADIVVAKNGTGLLIEMKYKGKADEALEQAKEYAELVKDTNTQIFIGCNITNQQEVFLSGDIVIDGAEPFHFDYP
jgi:hypothetical protein